MVFTKPRVALSRSTMAPLLAPMRAIAARDIGHIAGVGSLAASLVTSGWQVFSVLAVAFTR